MSLPFSVPLALSCLLAVFQAYAVVREREGEEKADRIFKRVQVHMRKIG